MDEKVSKYRPRPCHYHMGGTNSREDGPSGKAMFKLSPERFKSHEEQVGSISGKQDGMCKGPGVGKSYEVCRNSWNVEERTSV